MFFGKKDKPQPEVLGVPMEKTTLQPNPPVPTPLSTLPMNTGDSRVSAEATQAPRDDAKASASQPSKRAGNFFEPTPREATTPALGMNSPVGLDGTFIGKHVSIKGELVAKENIYLDGYFQGSIHTNGAKVTVGPNGRVNASISTTELVVFGVVEGNTEATEKIILRKNCSVIGDMTSPVIAIEEGVAVNGQMTCGTPRKADKVGADAKTNLKVVGENHG